MKRMMDMSLISQEIGKKIRLYRKRSHWTIEEIAVHIYKSKATVSKYERGEIAIDIETLYDIAEALRVSIDDLLYRDAQKAPTAFWEDVPTFFKHVSRLFYYYYDGRSNDVALSVIDILSRRPDGSFAIAMYMNCENPEQYQNCENTYTGYMKHYDSITNLVMEHTTSPMELYMINILAPFLDAPHKWAMGKGISFRPFMPVATKLWISKKPEKITKDFADTLRISKEDIRLLKLYNAFVVTG